MQQATTELVIELPYETASALFGRLSGVSLSSERLHTLGHQVAQGLSVVDVAPSREEIIQLVEQVSTNRFRPPCAVSLVDILSDVSEQCCSRS